MLNTERASLPVAQTQWYEFTAMLINTDQIHIYEIITTLSVCFVGCLCVTWQDQSDAVKLRIKEID